MTQELSGAPLSEAATDNSITKDLNYWAETFKGTPLSIVVPPYIRFLQGSILLYKSLTFLKAARDVAANGNSALGKILVDLESSEQSKQLHTSYEKFFASHLTITLVSEVEHFLGNAISAALRLYPEKMGSQTIKLSEIVSASSKDEIVDRAARSVMNALMYEKPFDYLKSLANILSIETEQIEQLWPVFVELKARRDIGVHNDWVANEIYIRKVREARFPKICAVGERLNPDFAYLQNSMDSCKKLVELIANELGRKWIPLMQHHGQVEKSDASDTEERTAEIVEPNRNDVRGQ